MNFYFIANNPDNDKYLNKKHFNDSDIIIVFNKSLFENYNSFKKAKKVFHIFFFGFKYLKIHVFLHIFHFFTFLAQIFNFLD